MTRRTARSAFAHCSQVALLALTLAACGGTTNHGTDGDVMDDGAMTMDDGATDHDLGRDLSDGGKSDQDMLHDSGSPSDDGGMTADDGGMTSDDGGIVGGDGGMSLDDGGMSQDDGGIVGGDGGSTDGTCPAVPGPCTPSDGTTGHVRLHGVVVTPDQVLCDADVVYSTSTGLIECVGDCADEPAASGARVVCVGGAIYPGLISDHDHMQYNHLPPWQHDKLYLHRSVWRGDAAYKAFTKAHSDICGGSPCNATTNCNTMRWGEARAVIGGTTSAVGTTGTSCVEGLVRDLDLHDLSKATLNGTSVYVDAETDPLDYKSDATGLQKLLGNYDTGTVGAIISHVGEGIDQAARDEFEDYDGLGLLLPRGAIVHGTAFSATQLGRMVLAGTSLVWSPRSNIDLYGDTSPVLAAHALGMRVALAPDWTPSGGMNQLDELRCVDHLNSVYYDKRFSDRELVRMVTLDAARAAALGSQLGSLEPGKLADLMVLAGARSRPYRALIEGRPEQVELVVRGGWAIYGAPELVAELAQSPNLCEPVPARTPSDTAGDVCGQQRSICLKSMTGNSNDTLAQVKAALESSLSSKRAANTACATDAKGCYQYDLFPLWSCTPPDESKCDLGYGGIDGHPSDGDMDGDGFADDADNCPDVWNPSFLGDASGVQADSDHDGLGDACDPCPLNPDTRCAATSPDDLDGDSVVNAADNCPLIYNPAQSDRDLDGTGDDCDVCPDAYNPMGGACPVSIHSVRNPADPDYLPAGTSVRFEGVWVTGVRALPDSGTGSCSKGFYVQEDGTTEWGGIWVFTSCKAPTVQVGNRVTLSGTLAQNKGRDEMDGAVYTVDDAGTTLPFGPLDVAASDIVPGGPKALSLQSMLVRVSNATTAGTISASTGKISLGGSLYLINTLYQNGSGISTATPAFAKGTNFPTLTGVMFWDNQTSIAPRIDADYGGTPVP